jgi:hypothetical protein
MDDLSIKDNFPCAVAITKVMIETVARVTEVPPS